MQNYKTQSRILTVNYIPFEGQHFHITFESDSPERNRLQTLTYDGFKLDVETINNTHPRLYSLIKQQMETAAKRFWRDQRSPLNANGELVIWPELPPLSSSQGAETFDAIVKNSFSHLSNCEK
jgi:hypothetical protein